MPPHSPDAVVASFILLDEAWVTNAKVGGGTYAVIATAFAERNALPTFSSWCGGVALLTRTSIGRDTVGVQARARAVRFALSSTSIEAPALFTRTSIGCRTLSVSASSRTVRDATDTLQ